MSGSFRGRYIVGAKFSEICWELGCETWDEDIFLLLLLFNLFTVQSLSQPTHQQTDSSSTLHSPPPSTPRLQPTRPFQSPRSQVSEGLGSSSLTEARPGRPLLYVCGDLISAGVCCLVGGSGSERRWRYFELEELGIHWKEQASGCLGAGEWLEEFGFRFHRKWLAVRERNQEVKKHHALEEWERAWQGADKMTFLG